MSDVQGAPLAATVHEMPSVVRPELWGVVSWDGEFWNTEVEDCEKDAWKLCLRSRSLDVPAYVFSIPAQGSRVVRPEGGEKEVL